MMLLWRPAQNSEQPYSEAPSSDDLIWPHQVELIKGTHAGGHDSFLGRRVQPIRLDLVTISVHVRS